MSQRESSAELCVKKKDKYKIKKTSSKSCDIVV